MEVHLFKKYTNELDNGMPMLREKTYGKYGILTSDTFGWDVRWCIVRRNNILYERILYGRILDERILYRRILSKKYCTERILN